MLYKKTNNQQILLLLRTVIFMDTTVNDKGEKLFLLAQSYMPAQDIQILKNPMNEKISPWYAVNDISSTIYTPEYTFDKRELMRFKKDN